MAKSPTITAYGRTWCHQQVYGLLAEMLETAKVYFEPSETKGIDVVHVSPGDGALPWGDRYECGTGPTIWLALVDLFKEDGNLSETPNNSKEGGNE